MPGNPTDCRQRARRCAELAMTARTPELRSMLLGLSSNWQNLAADLERTHVLLSEVIPDAA